MTTKTIKNLLTTSEVAEILGLTVGRISQLSRELKVGTVMGTTRIFTRSEFRKIERREDKRKNNGRKSQD